MKIHWFKRRGIFFFPASLVGWMLAIIACVYAVYAFIDIDSRSHSNSDTLINFFFSAILIGLAYSIIAYFTSAPEKGE